MFALSNLLRRSGVIVVGLMPIEEARLEPDDLFIATRVSLDALIAKAKGRKAIADAAMAQGAPPVRQSSPLAPCPFPFSSLG